MTNSGKLPCKPLMAPGQFRPILPFVDIPHNSPHFLRILCPIVTAQARTFSVCIAANMTAIHRMSVRVPGRSFNTSIPCEDGLQPDKGNLHRADGFLRYPFKGDDIIHLQNLRYV
jgi:hypothetical protein